MSVVDRAAHLAAARLSERLPGTGSDVQTILAGILRIADLLIVLGASFLAYWLWHGTLALSSFYLTPTLLGALLAANFLHLVRAYSAEALRRPALQVGKAVAAWVAASAALVAIAYLTSTSIIYSRGWALLWLVLAPLGFILVRGFAAARVARWRHRGLLSTRVAVIGSGELARAVARQLEDAPDQQFRVVGFFADWPDRQDAVAPKGGIDSLLADGGRQSGRRDPGRAALGRRDVLGRAPAQAQLGSGECAHLPGPGAAETPGAPAAADRRPAHLRSL